MNLTDTVTERLTQSNFENNKNRLFAGLLAIALLLCCALLFAAYQQYRSAIRAAAFSADNARLEAFKNISGFLNDTTGVLKTATFHLDSLERTTLSCRTLLDDMQRNQPLFSNLAIYNVKGEPLCEAKNEGVQSDLDPEFKYKLQKSLLSGQFLLTNPSRYAESERWYSSLFYPIRDSKGRELGSITVRVDLLQLGRIIEVRERQNNLVTGIINLDRIIIARSQDALLRVGRPANSAAAIALVEQSKSGKADVEYGMDYLGSDRLFSYQLIPKTDWVVFASIDLSSIKEATIDSLLWQVVAVLGLLLFASTLWLVKPKFLFSLHKDQSTPGKNG